MWIVQNKRQGIIQTELGYFIEAGTLSQAKTI